MTLAALQKRVLRGESETQEFKSTTGQRVEAGRTLCAYLNGKGGTVVFGVTPEGALKGQLVADKTRLELAEVFAKIEPFADVVADWVEVDATHTAIVCTVEKGNAGPYTFDTRPYKRVQSSTREMSRAEYHAAIRAAEGFQSKWEKQPNENLSLDDIDP